MATGYGLKLYNYRVFFENNSYDQTIYGLIGDKVRSFNRGTGAFTEIGGAYTIFDRFFVSNDRNSIYFLTYTGSSYQLNKLPITGGTPQNYNYVYPSVSSILGEIGNAVYWHQSAFDDYKLYVTVITTGPTTNWNVPVDSIRMIDNLLFFRDPSTNKVFVSTTSDPQAKSETGVFGYVYNVGKKGGYLYIQTSTGIYRLDSTGKNPTTLLSGASYSLQLCNNTIFYSTSDQKNIYKMNYDGSAKTLMHTFPEAVAIFTASISGDRIYFNRPNEDAFYVVVFNNPPTLTLTSPANNLSLSEGNTMAVQGSVTDADANDPVTIYLQINNGTILAVDSKVSDGATAIPFAKILTYKNKRVYSGTTDLVGVDLAENTDHTLKVWAEDNKQGRSTEVIRKFRIVWNRPPVIDGQNRDLGSFMQIPTVKYSATDPEGNTFTFSEYLNGKKIRSFAGVAGQQYKVEISHDSWIRLDLDVQHQIKVVATDSAGISSERIYTFTRKETHIEFMLEYGNPEIQADFTLDGMPLRVLVTLERYMPEGSSIESVKVCNNYLDAVPTWEDCTGAVKGNRGYLFTNKTKTAANWAINLWVILAKGTATERVRLNGYGGAFD
ncbi:DUF5050 domain-containing protein [Brevibacillus antibioticus]|uniref:DUF5050 domain-containing protein n=1 Tax=Brevibacillus antibioticus TaxID=2570228 RepID=A0A4U2YED3_9BACL|nr:DUF5050 domain-containing protein [Brevibacillus antibioticus]TKI58805.1 DUF5050 domain-containing protein [Brevibacillus antibioticus]